VFILPFFLIRNLNIPRQQWWRLVYIFSLGGISILMSITRVIALAASAETGQVAVWTALECSTAIMVACCPVLRPLLNRFEGVRFVSGAANIRMRQTNDKPSNASTESVRDIDWREDGRDNVELLLFDCRIGQLPKNVEFEIRSERASQSFETTRTDRDMGMK
jgi:hypothetical protein